MPLSRDNDYAMYLYTCNRCRSCVSEPSERQAPICPSYDLFGFFAFSGGGKGYVAQGIIEGAIKPSAELCEIAMNCLLCGACQATCPPGFDINSFIRDLRDHLVSEGHFLNEAHESILDNMDRRNNPWGRRPVTPDAPVFSPDKDLLVWLGCRERYQGGVLHAAGSILDHAGLSWGVLSGEPCCGAPYLDLGRKDSYIECAETALQAVEDSGAARMLILCPHCSSAMMADYVMDAGDLSAEPVTLPGLLSELVAEERIDLSAGEGLSVTYHDPCRLARWLEDTEAAREVLGAVPGLELIEMQRSREWGWCCGAGGFSERIAPRLSRHAAGQRIIEARKTGADTVITACSFCTSILKKNSRKRPKVVHLAEMVAERIKKPGKNG